MKHFGPYELLDKVGQGGMGAVYKATRREQPGFVAIKIANRIVTNDPVLAQRFHNEYTVANPLRHPHLVRALDYGIVDGQPYLVLEYVPGRSLSQRLQEEGPLPLAEGVALFTQIADAVAFIHDKDLVHRDIKPGNILIDGAGHAKLADLGLIKDLGSSQLLTHSRVGLGTVDYGAPEQFDDAKHADCRCDIYALAAAFYVALAGKPPFGIGGQMRILQAKLESRFAPLSQYVPSISAALDELVCRCLQADPEARPRAAHEFLQALVAEAGLLAELARPGEGLAAAPPGHEPDTEPTLAADPASPTVFERRGGTRFPTNLPGTLGTIAARRETGWDAQIVDISLTGMCLQLARRFEPEALFQVHLAGEQPGQGSLYLVRSRWVKRTPDGSWLMGCIFVNPLEPEDLERVLFSDTSRTTMFKR
jgi:serine/threonine protein kinase